MPGSISAKCGLRYRHMEDAPGTGEANALFFDGHAETLPINNNVSGAPANAPSANGSRGLRVQNIINPGMPSSQVNF